jgi:SAM-dependent methyltransferase
MPLRVGWKYARFAFQTVRRRGAWHTLADFSSEVSFDLWHGTRTVLPRELTGLSRAGGELSDAVQYQGANPRTVRELLRQIPQSARSGLFVDLGCGKGRGLILGASAGFTRLLGIEFAAELAEDCRRNLRRCRNAAVPPDAEVRVIDAALFEPPKGTLVVFLYNPFQGRTLERVVGNLERFAAEEGNVIWVVYVNPQGLEVFLKSGFEVEHEIRRGQVVFGVVLRFRQSAAG